MGNEAGRLILWRAPPPWPPHHAQARNRRAVPSRPRWSHRHSVPYNWPRS